MDMFSLFMLPAIVFLLTLVFGVWLSNSGKPYNGILFNLHKLSALGAVIAAGMQVAKVLISAGSLPLIIAPLIVAAICVAALFATGALMSMEKSNYQVMLTIHRIAPALVPVAMIALVYLLAGRNP